MNDFLENYKEFIEHYKIKQNILAIKTGYDKNKISRILSGKNSITIDDMNILAKALGKDIAFFMNKIIFNTSVEVIDENQIAFSAGVPTKEKNEYANKLFELIENVDLILGAEMKINYWDKNGVN